MSHDVSDPVVRALAELVRSAIRNTTQLVRWALDSGTVLVKPCPCRVISGEFGCVCNVEMPVPRAYMIRARASLERHEAPGLPPHRKCLLCLAGDHDLNPVRYISVAGPDGRELYKAANAYRVRRSKKLDLERSIRAHGLPPGTAASQWAAAGLPPH